MVLLRNIAKHDSMGIILDKRVYYPGENVQALFELPEKLPSRLRKIEIALEVFEDIKLQYLETSSTGGGVHREKIQTRDKFVIVDIKKEIDIDDLGGEDLKLTLSLPRKLPGSCDISVQHIEIKTKGSAVITYNRWLGKDFTELVEFDITAHPQKGIEVLAELIGLKLSMSNNVIKSGEEIEVTVEKDDYFNTNFSKLIIALDAKIEAEANGYETVEEETIHIIDEIENLPDDKLILEIPKLDQNTTMGKKFDLKHFLRFQFVKEMEFDDVIILPVYYYSL